ncbi:microcephalin [Brachyhypopomus gauderio]|uniref:microcephalin n=1 Tax=Brachyhypopomus gauderio TaxID=698409 RepID=UPI00404323E1
MSTDYICPAVLKDVVAYVDVWSASKTENYSDPFIHQLRDLGAQVPKTFNKQVTHVVFKNGHQSTWNKAKKLGVKIVSVHWVARCKENTEHADEDLYPAQNEESKLGLVKKRTHRCMQPRDIPLSSPKRLKRKLDKMMEGLVQSSPIVSDTSPLIIDEENGIVYSPSSRRADTMAQRLKEMRAQRENLSPTASQIQDSIMEDCIRPTLGETPAGLSKLILEDEEPSCSLSVNLSNSKSEGEKGYCERPSNKMKSHGHTEKEPCDSVDSLTRTEVLASPRSERPRRSCSSMKKQSSLDGYIRKTSSKKPTSHSLPKTEEGAIDLTKLSANMKKRKSTTTLGSTDSGEGQTPLCLKEANDNGNRADSRRLSFVDPSFSKYDHLAESKDLTTTKSEFCTRRPDTHGCDDDDSVFEDYFTSGNSVPRCKVVMVSSSEAMPLPSFDLESKRSRMRESHPPHICTRDGTQKVFSRRGHASGPGVSDSEKMKQEPAAKKQKRRMKSNSSSPVERKDSEGTSDGLTDRCSEMCSKHATMKTDKFVKKNRTLVMTSMPTEKQQMVIQVVDSLGGFTVVDTVCESTTHVVSGSPRRTLNVLLGIARGCWILSFEWILWCLEHRQWVPEEPYELSDHFPAAPICRLQQHLSAGEHQQDLFQDQPLMFVAPLSQPPSHSLGELIQLCGGAVSRTVRQAGLCIGEYKGKKPEGTKCLSERWILDCVTHLVLLPYDKYILK